MSRYAILLDGGFVTKKLSKKLKHYPTSDDIEAHVNKIVAHDALRNLELLRVYFYDAPPSQEILTNPLDGNELRLGETDRFKEAKRLIDKLEMLPDFALRQGETVAHGWKLGDKALKSMAEKKRAPEAHDFIPNIEQKGVDLRIGLDIARLSLREMVGAIVVVTGDSDFIPAFKFARREGVRVYLDCMDHGVVRDLKAHTDLVLKFP